MEATKKGVGMQFKLRLGTVETILWHTFHPLKQPPCKTKILKKKKILRS